MTELYYRYLSLLDDLFERDFVPANETLKRAISISPLIRNGAILLTGSRGTGKSSLVTALSRRLFVDRDRQPSLARVNCHQELIDTNVLYRVCFQNPDLAPKPRALLRKRFRFVDEIARMTPQLQNALLSYLAEGEVVFEDHRFVVPSGVMFLARNPMDQGQEGVVAALMDRFDMEISVPSNPCPIETTIRNELHIPLTEDEMVLIWKEVEAVDIPEETLWFAHMIHYSFSACIIERSTVNPLFELPCNNCEFCREVCSRLRATPGRRGIQAMTKAARAFAWLEGVDTVSIHHLLTVVPWVYAHRLEFHTDVYVEYPEPQVYLKEVFITGSIEARRENWMRAIVLFLEGEYKALADLAGMCGDLVIAWLASQCETERCVETENVSRIT